MPTWIPFDLRDDEAAVEWLGPHNGVPEWLSAPLWNWVEQFFRYKGYQGSVVLVSQAIQSVQIDLHLPVSYASDAKIVETLQSYAVYDETTFIRMVDWCIGHTDEDDHERIEQLEALFQQAGSIWTVGRDEQSTPQLQRRVQPTVLEAVRSSAPSESPEEFHLARSWSLTYGLQPNPSEAHREAVKAVKAAARPIISPLNNTATLGTEIADLKNKPSK